MSSSHDVWELSRAVLNERGGVVAVLKTYMDESGTHGDSPVVTVGAYIGQPNVWRDWTKDWKRQLHKVPVSKKPIEVFHAVDCANRDGEFEGWTREERTAFVIELLPIFPRHSIVGCAIGIHMKSFEEAMSDHSDLREMFGTPYTACFQWVIQTILNTLDAYRSDHRIAFFHECNDYTDEARKAFEWVQTNRPSGNKGITLAFGSKADYVPLQAADVLAYESNHVIRDPEKERRPSWGAIDPDQSRIKLLHYGKNNMDKLIAALTGLRQRLLASGWDGKVVV
jgi:hypothetical protein